MCGLVQGYIIEGILMLVTLAVCLPMLCACAGSGDKDVVDVVETSGTAISFSSDIAEQEDGLTRAPLNSGFTVYGYKYNNGTESAVFPGYDVEYSGGEYNYVKSGQVKHYWDRTASEYRFWACTGDWTPASDDVNHSKSLSLSNHPLRIGKTGNVSQDLAGTNLYASMVLRVPTVMSRVELKFSHPYSQVALFFYYEELRPGVTKLQIQNVRFSPVTPAAAGKVSSIYASGEFKVTYPTSGTNPESVSVTSGSNRPEGLDFIVSSPLTEEPGKGHGASNAVQAEIPSDQSAEDDPPYRFYYPLPMGNQNPDFQLTLDIQELSSTDQVLRTLSRSAIIPETYMHWKPNYAYRYFFKITTDATESIQCDVKVAPWKYGGSQEEEWKNW